MTIRNFGIFSSVSTLALVLIGAVSTGEARAATVPGIISHFSKFDGVSYADFDGFDRSLGTLVTATLYIHGVYTAILEPRYPGDFAFGVAYPFIVNNTFSVHVTSDPLTTKVFNLASNKVTFIGGERSIPAAALVDISIPTLGSARTVVYSGFSKIRGFDADPDRSSFDFTGLPAISYDYIPAPEPTSLVLVSSGLISFISLRRRDRRIVFLKCD